MPSTAPSPPTEAQLQHVAKAFATAQNSISSHRRTVASLHKTFLTCAAYTIQHKGQTRFAGEKEFMVKFRECMYRILPVKKGEQAAEKAVKFVGNFTAFAFHEAQKNHPDEEETPISRFVYALLKHLIPGLEAANKAVRYRVCQLMNALLCAPDMDEDLFAALMEALQLRLRDREAPVRAQAVLCLSKLSPEATLEALEDPSAEVRRAVLLVTDSPETLAARTRDVDITNRRVVCSRMSDCPFSALQEVHTRKSILAACKDREEVVRRAAGKMVSKWMGQDTLETFLGHFDLLNMPDEAQIAVNAAIRTRPDVAANLAFDDDYWVHLTPFRAFLARVVCQFYASNPAQLDEHLPVATALAHYIKDAWFALKLAADDEEAQVEQQFVLDQLLQLSSLIDFTDEAGRRAMMDGFIDADRPSGVRIMLADPEFPESLLGRAFDLLAKLVDKDSEFMHIVVELVQDLRSSAGIEAPSPPPEDSDDDSDQDVEDALTTPASKNVPKRLEPTTLNLEHAAIHIRCLLFVKHLLERVIAPIKENPMLKGMVHEVIVPAIRTKNEEIRQLGIQDLGLCCLLDRDMATESFGLYVNQAMESGVSEEMRESVFRIIFDILLLYGVDILADKGHSADSVITFVEQALEREPVVQAVAAVGICKLLLQGIVTDETVLSKLVIVYFAPETAENQALRQCLTYHFPAYCYSSAANQRRMASILVPTLDILTDVYEDMADEGMVPPAQIAAQLIDWTDPSKQVDAVQEKDDSLHAMVALDFLKAVYSRPQKDVRKRFCQLLSKLHLPPDLDPYKLRNLMLLIETIDEEKPLADTVSKNALNKFEASLRKLYADKVDALDEVQMDQVEDVHDWIQAADAQAAAEAARAAENDEYEEEAPASSKSKKKKPAPRARAPSKRARSTSAAPSEPDAETSIDAAPRRSARSRSAQPRKVSNSKRVDKMLAEQGLEEVDEEEDEAEPQRDEEEDEEEEDSE